jgi:hypothetical protein
VAADVACNFAAGGGEADQDGVLQVQLVDERCKIIGVGVHFVAVPGLIGPAVAATVMGDAAITVGRQEEHLSLATVRTQRPPMTEYDGLTRAPVLVVDLGAVFGGDRVHVMAPSVVEVIQLPELVLLPDIVFFMIFGFFTWFRQFFRPKAF